MAYSDFTLESVTAAFNLTLAEQPDLFAGTPAEPPSDWLATMLRGGVPLARAINTEKARSELMIAPVLAEVRLQHPERCSLFSGTELNVAPEQGLRGYCDFILSRSPLQMILTAPVVMITEAKNQDLASGFGQCAAGMVAAALFNERKGAPLPATYGVVSTGDLWQFLRLQGTALTIDMRVYHIDEVEKILGVLVALING